MKCGIYISNYALKGDPEKFVKLARIAEEAGWQGFFMWDHVYPRGGKSKFVADPWITLAAIAATTSSIRIGTTVTPLPRRRPQKVAREVTTLDRLSGGRFTLGVGLGHPPDCEFEFFGEDPSFKIRAEKLDESLEILDGLWSGKPFSFSGKHYHIETVTFKPRPVQKPRVPIWCAGWWPKKAPFRRAARYDGVFPLGEKDRLKPKDFRDILGYVKEHRKTKGQFDLILLGRSRGDPHHDSWIRDYEDAGASWFVELIMGADYDKYAERISKGPPSQ